MWPFKGYYFFFFAAMAFVAPFFTLYYEGLGLTGQQIGVLAALPSVITFVSAPVFGAVVDVTQRQKLVLGLSITGVIAGVLWIWFSKTFLGLIPAIVFYAFFFAPALPLVDRSVLDVLGTEKDQYGKVRLWGAVGWGVLAPLSGFLVDWGGLQWAFYGSAVLFLGLLIVSQMTPIQRVDIQQKFWSGVRNLLSSWQVILFFGVMLVGGLGLSSVHHYLFLYLDHLGASPKMMGFALTIATISELGVMFFSDRILKRWQARGFILIGLLFTVLRLAAYAMVTTPELALVVQLLHGPTFAALWLAGVAYVAEIAPPSLGNTAQGIYTGVVMGLGSALGAYSGGVLFRAVGFSQMFMGMALVVLLSVIVFWVGGKQHVRS